MLPGKTPVTTAARVEIERLRKALTTQRSRRIPIHVRWPNKNDKRHVSQPLLAQDQPDRRRSEPTDFDGPGAVNAEMAVRTAHCNLSEADLRALVFALSWNNAFHSVMHLIEDARSDPSCQTEALCQDNLDHD